MTYHNEKTNPLGVSNSNHQGETSLNRRTYLKLTGAAALLGGVSVGTSGQTVDLDPIRGVAFDGTPLAVGAETVGAAAEESGSVIEPMSLALGQTHTGMLGDGADVYTFETAAGEALSLDVEGDAHVGLFDSAGGVVDMTSSQDGSGVLSVASSTADRLFVQVSGVSAGTYALTATASAATQSPYGGSAWSVPGTIEAEDYDEGGQDVAYYDTSSGNNGGAYRSDDVDIQATHDSAGGSYNVGWMPSGEWLEYTVDVDSAGTYDVDFRVSCSESDGAAIRLEADGTDVTGTVSIPDTGGDQSWTTVTATGVSLDSGQQVLRVYVEEGWLNFNFMEFSGGGGDSTAPSAPANLSSPAKTDSSVDLNWDASSDSGGSGLDHYNIYVDGAVDHQVAAGTTSSTVSGLSSSTSYDFHVTAVDGAGNESSASNTITQSTDSASGQSPYGGSARPIPGTVEVEDYDEGGEGVAYHDSDSGNSGGAYRSDDVDIESTSDSTGDYHVGWISTDEWLEYTVDVDSAGTYDVDFRIASTSTGSLRLESDGTDVTGTVSIPDTGGWQNWTTVTATGVSLDSGQQVLRVYVESAGFNFNFMEFSGGGGDSTAPSAPANLSSPAKTDSSVDLNWDASSDSGGSGLDHYNIYVDGAVDHQVAAGTTSSAVSGLSSGTSYDFHVTAVDGAGNESSASNAITVSTDSASGQSPYGGSAHDVTSGVEAEDFDEGGEGVAYSDTTAGNDGDASYRNSDVDIETQSDDYNVGYIEAGEWLEYTVDVPQGTYDIEARVASSGGGGEMTVELDGTSLGTYNVPDTGGWNSWTTISIDNVSVSGGTSQVMRLDIVSGGFNFDWVAFMPSGTLEREQITMDGLIGANGFNDDPVEVTQAVGFVREYHDWDWDEPADTDGDGTNDYPGYPNNEIKWNPSYAGGGWNFDQYYSDIANNNIGISPASQGSPSWLGSHIDHESCKPLDESGADAFDPNSYEAKAHHMYQYAARYGDTSVDMSKLTLADDQDEKTGLGLVNYYELWNEQNRDWEGECAYFEPGEYAAMASASYDGHEGTMTQGTGTFGVKNADPNSKLVMGGTVGLALDYIKDIDTWFQNNRSDGEFVLDVINVHEYTYVAGEHGLSPEEGNLRSNLEDITTWRDNNYPEKEVWLSEFGWDTHPDSELVARPIGSYDEEEVQGQWLVRGYMEIAAAGVDRAQMFMIRNGNTSDSTKYSTSGLTLMKEEDWARKTSWYYVSTMKNTLSDTRYAGEKSSGHSDVRIYKFADQSSSGGVYALWCPTVSETHVTDYQLDLDGSPSSATLVEMVDGNETGQPSSLSISNNSVTVDVSERPIFVQVDDI